MTNANDPPHPLHVVDATMFWSRAGGGVRRYLEAKRCWLRDHQPLVRHTIAAPWADLPGMARLPASTLPWLKGYRFPMRRGALTHALAGLHPDIIEAGDPYRLAWAALDAARALGIPALAFCHSNLELLARKLTGPRLGPWMARSARRYARHLYSNFDLVLAPSEAMRRHLLDWGVPRVACQPLGVDTQAFHPDRASPAWREGLGLAPNARLLVYAGRLAPEKNLDVLADTVQRLGAPYTLLLIGDGPIRPAGQRVVVHSPILQPARLAMAIASADAFVHAGDQETFGLSLLEALACGTPVVARAAEGLAELVDERVGMPVHGGRADDFAQAIAALFERDRAGLALEARARAERHDWTCVLPSLMSHYRRLLGRSAGADPARLPPAFIRTNNTAAKLP